MPEDDKAIKEVWKPNLYKVNVYHDTFDEVPTEESKLLELRKRIEPWMSAVFQSEHLSLLVGSGLTSAIAHAVGATATDMTFVEPESELAANITEAAEKSAKSAGRGLANIEDCIRVKSELLRGLQILRDDAHASQVHDSLNAQMTAFLESLLQTEREILKKFTTSKSEVHPAQNMLVSFILSFAARASSRERLNIFTTNYDRLIEFACDVAGLRPIDRFVGALSPVFRASRLNIDMHYNPPGIRGEPRYLEGVVRLSKLHGSLDWHCVDGEIRRISIPFGAPTGHPDIPTSPLESVMIYPNPAKDVETAQYPYAELFRDFASSICRPNSVLVTYGYGFGDDHINRVMRDMLTIPSTHLVIIAYGDEAGRIQRFYEDVGHSAQITLLVGSHFGSLQELVDRYLPKPAIDPISYRQADLLDRRGISRTAEAPVAYEQVPGNLSTDGGQDDEGAL